MTPTSDVDLLAVTSRPLTQQERRRLVSALLALSAPPQDEPNDGDERPIELTVVVQDDVRPWRFPPVMDFQFGDWLRPDIERGVLPQRISNADLAVLISIAWQADAPLLGPSIHGVLDAVPHADLVAAMHDGLGELARTLAAGSDDRNVLLTLARIWMTLETGRIARKDVAAEWAADRLDAPDRKVMLRARQLYLDGKYGPWDGLEARIKATAATIMTKVSGNPLD